MSRRNNFSVPSVQRPSQLVAVEDMQRAGGSFISGPHSHRSESMRSRGRQSLRHQGQSSHRSHDSSLNMNAPPFVPHGPKSSQRSLGPVQEECRRVRKQIEKLAADLAAAFAEEQYDQVKDIGERKKKLEDQLEKFEAQYAKDQKDISTIKAQIAGLKDEIEEAYKNEDFTKVKELGDTKKKLQQELADIEANFGLANENFYKVGDQIELTGLQTPRGSLMNGTPGIIREYMPKEKRYKIEIVNADGTTTVLDWSGSSRESAIRGIKLAGHKPVEGKSDTIREIAPALLSPKGNFTFGNNGGGRNQGSMIAVQPKNIRKRKDYQTQPGEIKLWFPKKHFGFITPDNKEKDEPDIFFHGSHVLNCKDMPIRRYSKVSFRIIPAPKGPQARDVTIVSGPDPADREKAVAASSNNRATAGSEIPKHLYSPTSQTSAEAPTAGATAAGNEGSTDAPKDGGSAGATETQKEKEPEPTINLGALPPLSMVSDPGQMERWASCKSTEEMDFSGGPPNLDTPSSKLTPNVEDNPGQETPEPEKSEQNGVPDGKVMSL